MTDTYVHASLSRLVGPPPPKRPQDEEQQEADGGSSGVAASPRQPGATLAFSLHPSHMQQRLHYAPPLAGSAAGAAVTAPQLLLDYTGGQAAGAAAAVARCYLVRAATSPAAEGPPRCERTCGLRTTPPPPSCLMLDADGLLH